MRVYRRLSGGRAVTIKSAHNCQDCQPRTPGQTPAQSLIRIREQISRDILQWSCSCGEFKREKWFSILTLAGGGGGGGDDNVTGGSHQEPESGGAGRGRGRGGHKTHCSYNKSYNRHYHLWTLEHCPGLWFTIIQLLAAAGMRAGLRRAVLR